MCWLYKQQLCCIRISAYLLVAKCNDLFSFSSIFALCSQDTADVLSPKAKKQGYSSLIQVSIDNHTEIMDATNSSELFSSLTNSLNSVGISHLHAIPSSLYPPIPCGQASDQHKFVGRRYAMRFKLIPLCIFGRKQEYHKCRSWSAVFGRYFFAFGFVLFLFQCSNAFLGPLI
jgi:hypothetical protein